MSDLNNFDKNKLIYSEKPESLSFVKIFEVLNAAHAANPEVDYTTATLTEEEVLQKLSLGGKVFVAFYDGFLVGTTTINIEKKNYTRWYIVGKTATLRYMAVRPEYKGKGIASTLAKKCIDWANQNQVETLLWDTAFNNVSAMATAKKCNFQKVDFFKLSKVNHPTVRLAQWLKKDKPSTIYCMLRFNYKKGKTKIKNKIKAFIA